MISSFLILDLYEVTDKAQQRLYTSIIRFFYIQIKIFIPYMEFNVQAFNATLVMIIDAVVRNLEIIGEAV